MTTFDPLHLEPGDLHRACQIVGGIHRLYKPDLEIAPDGSPYLYRWHVVDRNKEANVYLHIQVASDPERPLHDHPWDNQSVILAGGYLEIIQENPPWSGLVHRRRNPGDTVQRKATESHRLVLPMDVPYTMSLFTTGPVKRDWGFWMPTHKGRPQWHSHQECIVNTPDGKSIFRNPLLAGV